MKKKKNNHGRGNRKRQKKRRMQRIIESKESNIEPTKLHNELIDGN